MSRFLRNFEGSKLRQFLIKKMSVTKLSWIFICPARVRVILFETKKIAMLLIQTSIPNVWNFSGLYYRWKQLLLNFELFILNCLSGQVRSSALGSGIIIILFWVVRKFSMFRKNYPESPLFEFFLMFFSDSHFRYFRNIPKPDLPHNVHIRPFV